MAYQDMQLIFEEEPGESAPFLKALSSLIAENNLKKITAQMPKYLLIRLKPARFSIIGGVVSEAE